MTVCPPGAESTPQAAGQEPGPAGLRALGADSDSRSVTPVRGPESPCRHHPAIFPRFPVSPSSGRPVVCGLSALGGGLCRKDLVRVNLSPACSRLVGLRCASHMMAPFTDEQVPLGGVLFKLGPRFGLLCPTPVCHQGQGCSEGLRLAGARDSGDEISGAGLERGPSR